MNFWILPISTETVGPDQICIYKKKERQKEQTRILKKWTVSKNFVCKFRSLVGKKKENWKTLILSCLH